MDETNNNVQASAEGTVQQVEQQPQVPDSTPPQVYNFGGKEWKPDELESTLSNYSKLQAEYTQKSQELAELRKRDDQVKNMYSSPEQTPEVDPSEAKQYAEIAKTLAPYLKDSLGLDTTINQILEQERQKEAMVSRYKEDLSRVEDTAKKAGITFSQDELVGYMKEKQIADVEAAFRAKHFADLVAYEAKHQAKTQNKVYVEDGVKAPLEGTAQKFSDPTDKAFKASLVEKFKQMAGM